MHVYVLLRKHPPQLSWSTWRFGHGPSPWMHLATYLHVLFTAASNRTNMFCELFMAAPNRATNSLLRWLGLTLQVVDLGKNRLHDFGDIFRLSQCRYDFWFTALSASRLKVLCSRLVLPMCVKKWLAWQHDKHANGHMVIGACQYIGIYMPEYIGMYMPEYICMYCATVFTFWGMSFSHASSAACVRRSTASMMQTNVGHVVRFHF